MTGEYAFVALDRQDALTRAIQERLAKAAPNSGGPDTDLTQSERLATSRQAKQENQRETCPEACASVFHGAHSHPVDAHLNGWPEACKRAGVPGLLFHDLRRSAVRNMKRAGIQDLEAMRISGHRTRAIFDRYNIIDEDDLADAGKRLEEYAQKCDSSEEIVG
jgi:integrase